MIWSRGREGRGPLGPGYLVTAPVGVLSDLELANGDIFRRKP